MSRIHSLPLRQIWIVCITIMAIASMTMAAPKGAKSSAPKTAAADKNRPQPKGNLKSDHNFDQAVVQGKYQIANEGLAIVEDEKSLDDLLGMRFEFKDRLRKQMR